MEEGCPDCGQDTVAVDPDDEDNVYCSDPRCGWRP